MSVWAGVCKNTHRKTSPCWIKSEHHAHSLLPHWRDVDWLVSSAVQVEPSFQSSRKPMFMNAFHQRREFAEQLLSLFGLHPGLEMIHRVITYNIDPLLLRLTVRLKRIGRQISRIARLRGD